jgi:hypothetical protein
MGDCFGKTALATTYWELLTARHPKKTGAKAFYCKSVSSQLNGRICWLCGAYIDPLSDFPGFATAMICDILHIENYDR